MNCLDLVKLKDYCDASYTGPFVSDYVDVSNIMLAHLANDAEQTGKEFGESLINGAIEQVKADCLLSASQGYKFQGIVYHYNNTCKFTDTYTNWGTQLNSFYRSANSTINIGSITYKANFSGAFNIVIDDGSGTLVIHPAMATAGMEVATPITYSTKQRLVRIYAEDPSLLFAMLSCQQGGCGSCASKRGIYISAQGWNRTSVTSQPSGFSVQAFIACDEEALMCAIIGKYAALFQKAIAYQVGIRAYTRLLITPRLNDTTLNINEDNAKVYLNTLEAKYRELMFGSAQAYGNAATTGIIQVMRQSYKGLNDMCVVCDAQVNTATVIF
jgi:hypothetical protein